MAKRFDVLIRGARIFDGGGGPALEADLAIADDRVASIGALEGATAPREVDAGGLALSPGFIDVHTHDDFAALVHPAMGFKLRGGVTSCVVGNCGFGPAPFAEARALAEAFTPRLELDPYDGFRGYFERLEDTRPGANIGVLAGHGTIRLAVLGRADRAPTGRELDAMKVIVREAADAGALGLSTGLIYEPGRYADTEEIAELTRELRGTGALYATHMRDEGGGLLASVREAIAIGAQAGAPVQISHLKASGRENWGRVAEALALIQAAQARGEDVHADQYPYTAGSTILRAVMQNDAFTATTRVGGIGAVRPQDVVVASASAHPEWEGRSIAVLADAFACPPQQAAERVERESPGATVVVHMMSEDDVQTVLRHPATMIGSDGIPTLEGKPHPRLYNTFARVLGHYARDLGVVPLETAIHRMTGFPARKFRLRDRGVVAEGAFADLVVFDPARIIDRGTFEDPNRYPDGIEHVFVNGRHAVQGGALTGIRAGRALLRAD